MAKVYLVSSGSYSDYRIVAAFSTQEKAQAYIDDVALYARGHLNDLEEYEVDEPREALPGVYQCTVDESGEIETKAEFYTGFYLEPAVIETRRWNAGKLIEGRWFRGTGLTPEHARRSAEEARRQTLALEGKVVTSPSENPSYQSEKREEG